MATSLPQELREALAGNAAARLLWDRLPPSHQREYIVWIESAKREETRGRRAGKALEMILKGK